MILTQVVFSLLQSVPLDLGDEAPPEIIFIQDPAVCSAYQIKVNLFHQKVLNKTQPPGATRIFFDDFNRDTEILKLINEYKVGILKVLNPIVS